MFQHFRGETKDSKGKKAFHLLLINQNTDIADHKDFSSVAKAFPSIAAVSVMVWTGDLEEEGKLILLGHLNLFY